MAVKEELKARLSGSRVFSPFVITLVDGFAVAVDAAKRILLGQKVFAVKDATNRRRDAL